MPHVPTPDTTSSVDVLALFFGAKANDPESNDLGQTKLSIVNSPNFSITPFTLNVDLTLPIDLINGLNRTYDLTCGEFYTLGVSHPINKQGCCCYTDVLICETGRKYTLYLHFPGAIVCCLTIIERGGIVSMIDPDEDVLIQIISFQSQWRTTDFCYIIRANALET